MSDLFPVVANETQRLDLLRSLEIFGTAPEDHFDAVCRTACALFGVPIALVSMIDEEQQWFKAKCGISIDVTSRDLAFCSHAILSNAVLMVEDARRDPRFAQNALVIGDPGIRFYAGAPLEVEPGLRVGTLCVIDLVPRTLSPGQCRQLQDLAAIVVAHLRLAAASIRARDETAAHQAHEGLIAAQAATLRQREARLSETNRLLVMAEQMAHVGYCRLQFGTDRRTWSAEMYRIFGIDPRHGEPNLNGLIQRCHPDDRHHVRAAWDEALAKRCDFNFETRVVRPSGDVRTVVVRATYEPDGSDGAFIIVTMDVTDLHRTEVRLIESEGRVKLLVEGITDCAICMLDPHGVVTNWHAGGERIYGYGSEEFFGQHVSRLYTVEDQAAGLPRAALGAAVAEGRATSEGWRVRKDGRLFWACDLIQPIRDNQGTLIGFAQLSRDATEQRQAAEALRISEARYRLLTDSSNDMIAQLDRDGRRIYISPASQDLLGYAPEELIGTRPSDMMHPDDVPAFLTLIASLASGEMTRAVSVNRLRHRDGRWIWIEASLHMLRDAMGQPDGFLAAVRNTTDRRRAEEDLRESETRYRILADSLPQMVWIMDRESRDTSYANRRFETYYGMIGTGFGDRMTRYHPDDRATVERAWNDGLIVRGGWEADLRLKRRDGVFRWHKVMIVPIQCGDEIVSWLGTALDIHDAVTAQDALLQSTDLLRIAQTAAGAGAWDVALGADAIVLSPESAAMHGLDGSGPTTLTAAEWNELVHPEDSVKVWSEVKHAVEAQEIYSAEFRVLLPDGGVRWVHGIGRAYFDAHGNPVRLVGLNFDVDRRKQVEAALIEAGQAAETARREAEKASAAKSDFLAAMSHEIRTPLNSILGYTELLLDAGPHEPLDRTKLSRILGSGRALLTIVNDVLDFSKIEAGRIELEPETFSLAGLIADTMSMISGIAMDKPLSLRTDIDPDLPSGLVGDQNRLRQVLLNLLNNAVKFTPSGDVVLTMRCERRIGDRLRLRCEVSDTGIGVPHDKRDQLFQRFSQIDGSISRRFGGTGLGLAISKNLVELMGGEIGYASGSGPGSTFWFTAELAIADAAPALAEPTIAPMVTHRPVRILLVEDVVMNQDIAMAVLSIGGHHVDLACDGAEAVQAVQNGAYDIVLMDIQMPVMDGIEATTRIRALGGHYARIPIVALTANVLPEQIEAFKRAGMVDHIGKPFRKADLLSAVARSIQAGADVPEIPSPFFDHDTFVELRDLLGRVKVGRMLDDLETVLTSGFVLDPVTGTACRDPDRDPAGLRMADVAHKLVSSAGMLGFMILSETCRAFERASRAGRLTEADIDLAAEASRLALAAMAPLRRNPDGLSSMDVPLLRSAS